MKLIKYLSFLFDKYCYGQPDALTFKQWLQNQTKVIMMLVAMCLVSCGLNSPGHGEKIGQIVKVSKHGVFRETWEGQIIRGGMTAGSGTVGVTPFDFTIESEELANKVQQMMRDQTEVVITYRTEGVYSALRSDSGGDFLETIEPSKK